MKYNYNFYYNLYKYNIWSYFYQWSSFKPQWDVLDHLKWIDYSSSVTLELTNATYDESSHTLIDSNSYYISQGNIWEIRDVNWNRPNINETDEWFTISNNIVFLKKKIDQGGYFEYYLCDQIPFKDIVQLNQEISTIQIAQYVNYDNPIVKFDESGHKEYYLYNLPFHTGILVNRANDNIKMYPTKPSEGSSPINYKQVNIKNQDIVFSICQDFNKDKTIEDYIFTTLSSIDGYYFKLAYNQGKPYYKILYTQDVFNDFNQNYTLNYNFYWEKYYAYQEKGSHSFTSPNVSKIQCINTSGVEIPNSYLTDIDENYMIDFYIKDSNNDIYENYYIDINYEFVISNSGNQQDQQININCQDRPNTQNYYIRIY